jgi:hypothetical protein
VSPSVGYIEVVPESIKLSEPQQDAWIVGMRALQAEKLSLRCVPRTLDFGSRLSRGDIRRVATQDGAKLLDLRVNDGEGTVDRSRRARSAAEETCEYQAGH